MINDYEVYTLFTLRLFFAYRSLILRSSFGVGISEVKGRYERKNSVSILF